MNSISILVLFGTIGVVLGSNCRDLSGLWRNQLGSNMTIIHLTSNRLTGEYSTAVESKLNAAVVASNITGTFLPMNDGALLSFTVLFNRGKSLTTWVGQCNVCEGEEVLHTSWVLKSYSHKKSERWMTTRINQDTFRRVPGRQNIPRHLRVMGPLQNDERSQTCEKAIKAASRGEWISESEESVDFINCFESGVFSGSHREKELIGRSEHGEPFTALGFISEMEGKIKGWAGHIYEGLDERILETAWLSHTFSNSCKNPRGTLHYGMSNYTFGVSRGSSTWDRVLNYIWS